MASTGQLTPGTVSQSSIGGVDWVNPSNVIADDATYATHSIASEEGSEILYVTNFGVAISTDEVQGIEVTIDDNSTFGGGSVRAFMTKDGSIRVGGSYTYSSSGLKTLGGPTNLWGLSWTEAEVEASTFGVTFAGETGPGQTLDASIDYVRVNVYYSDWVPETNADETLRVVSSGARWR